MTIDLERDEVTGTYRTTVDWDSDLDPSVAVVHAVTEASGRDETDLRPLHESVDGDALDRLLRRPGQLNGTLEVTITYEGYEITMSSDGSVVVDPVE